MELAKETEKIACKGDARKYTDFYATGVYGGIATGYTVGCCLRCMYCWVDWSRDYPERFGEFYTPKEAFDKLVKTAKDFGVRKMRISGAEPTLGRSHLIGLLELIEKSEFDIFILETNGILFGADKSYVSEISKFKKPHIRLSLKAATSEGFQEKTGAKGEYFELPYHAIRHLIDVNVSFHVAAMKDKIVMKRNERKILLQKLADIDINLATHLEEERIDHYKTTLNRMEKGGIELRWVNEGYAER